MNEHDPFNLGQQHYTPVGFDCGKGSKVIVYIKEYDKLILHCGNVAGPNPCPRCKAYRDTETMDRFTEHWTGGKLFYKVMDGEHDDRIRKRMQNATRGKKGFYKRVPFDDGRVLFITDRKGKLAGAETIGDMEELKDLVESLPATAKGKNVSGTRSLSIRSKSKKKVKPDKGKKLGEWITGRIDHFESQMIFAHRNGLERGELAAEVLKKMTAEGKAKKVRRGAV